MIRLHVSFFIPLLLCVDTIRAKPFGSFSAIRRNAPTNLLASVSFDLGDLDDILLPTTSLSTRKKSSGFSWQAVSESIVKSVAAILFARCLFILTGIRKETETPATKSSDSDKESTISASSSSAVPALPPTAEWKDIIERVNYLQATLHDYFEMWKRQIEEHDTGMNVGWVTCMEVSEQNAHLIHELSLQLDDLRNQMQGFAVPQVSEETIVETTTTVESEIPLSEEVEE